MIKCMRLHPQGSLNDLPFILLALFVMCYSFGLFLLVIKFYQDVMLKLRMDSGKT